MFAHSVSLELQEVQRKGSSGFAESRFVDCSELLQWSPAAGAGVQPLIMALHSESPRVVVFSTQCECIKQNSIMLKLKPVAWTCAHVTTPFPRKTSKDSNPGGSLRRSLCLPLHVFQRLKIKISASAYMLLVGHH
ncbi:hypothetical protein STEG23_022769, partial [Scotinomys teguina]